MKYAMTIGRGWITCEARTLRAALAEAWRRYRKNYGDVVVYIGIVHDDGQIEPIASRRVGDRMWDRNTE